MPSEVVNLHYDLVSRCKAGEEDAHFQLYRLYSKAMYNAAFRITKDEDDARDVLQEAFTSAFRNLHFYRAEAPFGAWLKRVVVNKALTVLQKKKFERIPEDERWDVAEEDDQVDADNLTVERVKRAILDLPDGYRTVLSLYLLEGYDHQEIAEILNVSESTSKSQLNRAKSKLREVLAVKVKG